MKKLLAILGLAAITTGLQAQGLVTFYSFSGTIKTNTALSSLSGGNQVGGTAGAITGTANSFYFTVLISSSTPSSNPTNSGWTQALYAGSGIIGTNYSGLAGDMQGPKGTSSTPIDNWSSGSTENYIIVGWSANLGTTWSAVYQQALTGNWVANGFFGASSVASGASGTPPTGTPLSLFTGTGTFSMYAVTSTPEPGTMALAGLGIAGLLALRRKK